MTREFIIQKTINVMSTLPQDKLEEISDFADFILKKYEEHTLQQGIYKLNSESTAFNFLNEDENLYSSVDIKEKF